MKLHVAHDWQCSITAADGDSAGAYTGLTAAEVEVREEVGDQPAEQYLSRVIAAPHDTSRSSSKPDN